MEITLHRADLKDEFKDINTSNTKFKHFNPTAQKVIKIAGRALFVWLDTYNAIYPPEK